jgi:hypothetical protein
MKTIPLNLYTFNELSEKAQNKAIDSILYELVQTNPVDVGDFAIKASQKADKMQTPWFYHEYLWEYGENEIRENFILPNYYTIDGDYHSPIESK